MHNSVNQLDLYLSDVGGGERPDFIYLFIYLYIIYILNYHISFQYTKLLKQLNQSVSIHQSVSQSIEIEREKADNFILQTILLFPASTYFYLHTSYDYRSFLTSTQLQLMQGGRF